MWTARVSNLSKCQNYNYFHDAQGYIGHAKTLQELLDYIRNPEDGYEKLHLENSTGKDGEADNNGIKYYLTIRSLTYGCPVEFEIYDLDDIDNCDEFAKMDLLEARELVKMAAYMDRKCSLLAEIACLDKLYDRAERKYFELSGVYK